MLWENVFWSTIDQNTIFTYTQGWHYANTVHSDYFQSAKTSIVNSGESDQDWKHGLILVPMLDCTVCLLTCSIQKRTDYTDQLEQPNWYNPAIRNKPMSTAPSNQLRLKSVSFIRSILLFKWPPNYMVLS